MPDLPGMPSTIRCATCGFENTTTSLYCQDCGVRLVAPPSAILEQPADASSTPVVQTQKSKPRIVSVNRPNLARTIFVITLRVLIFAAVAAFVTFLILPPKDLPPPASPLSRTVIENVRAALQRSAQMQKPFVAPWDGQGLNAYLAGVIHPSEEAGKFRIVIAGASLLPTGGGFSLIVERKVLGVSIYTSITYRLVSRGSGLGLVLDGAAVGRVPLPVWIAPAIEFTNDGIAQNLAPELQILRGAQNVQVTPQKAFVNFGPSRP